MKRPPVRVKCERLWLDVGDPMKSCRFVCAVPGPGVTAMFKSKHRRDHYAIMHPSAKPVGMVQVTDFDKHGPISDVRRKTCEEALTDMGITPQHYRLASVAGAPRAVQARLRRAARGQRHTRRVRSRP